MRESKGFTLLELVFVCALAALMAAAGAPLFKGAFGRLGGETGARRLAALLEYAHARAVWEGVPWRVAFDGEKNAFWPEAYRMESSAFERVREQSGREQTLVRGCRLVADKESVLFRPDGTSEDLSARIISAGEDVTLVRVDALTGRTKVSPGEAP